MKGEHVAWVADAIRLHGAQQDAWELTRLLNLVGDRLDGGLVVEIGCDQGGTLWLWRQAGADVIGVTLHTRPDGAFNAHGATIVEGDSTSSTTQRRLWKVLADRRPDLVFVDGGHDAATAESDITLALGLAPHGLVVVHDICRRADRPAVETWLAWGNAQLHRPHVEIVRSRGNSPGTGILWPGRT